MFATVGVNVDLQSRATLPDDDMQSPPVKAGMRAAATVPVKCDASVPVAKYDGAEQEDGDAPAPIISPVQAVNVGEF